MSQGFGGNDYESTTKISPISFTKSTEEPIRGLSEQDKTAIQNLPAQTALLVVRKGPNMGARFLLDDEKTLAGRHPNSDIFLDDVTVSRKHAAFIREGDGFVIRDLGSLNGTYVERERVDEARLSEGSEIQIGKYRFSFHTN